jgi:hypothetical protein
VWLASDDASSWSEIQVGGPNTVQNSQCAISGPGSAIGIYQESPELMVLNIAIAFKAGFAGTQTIYGRSANYSGFDSGYQPIGTYTVQ